VIFLNRIISKTNWKIEKSESIIGFQTTGGGDWEVWDRYLTIDGEKAYHIGNVCGTCSFFFERLGGANKSVSPKEVTKELSTGLKGLDQGFLKKVSKIIPAGDYFISLLNIAPTLCTIGGENDYFANEQVKLWGINGFWGFPHHPKIQYYRGETKKISEFEMLFEFIIPMFPQRWLDQDTVNKFVKHIEESVSPTAIALSVLDIKEPGDWKEEIDVTSHWCLAHYIIDGHHKVFASVLSNKPITLLSFLALDKGVSNPKNIKQLAEKIL